MMLDDSAAGSAVGLDLASDFSPLSAIDAGMTLPPSWYSDPEIYERQVDTIFRTTWQYAGAVTALASPGDQLVRRVGDLPVVLVNDAGELRGFINACRHRFAPVAAVDGCADTLRCTYHGWVYGLDGQLRSGVGIDAEPRFNRDRASLLPVSVDRVGPFIFVNPDPNARSVAADFPELHRSVESLGLQLAGYRHLRRQTWSLDANWLCLVENGLECTHCPTVHPSYTREYGISPSWLEDGDCIGHIYDGKNGGDGFTILNAFPNSILWQDGTSAFSSAVVPYGPERCVLEGDIWVRESLDDAAAEAAALGIDEVVREDIAPVELQHIGAKLRGMVNGELFPEADRGVAHWHRRVAQRVSGEL